MLSLAQVEDDSRRAAQRAPRDKKRPFTIEAEDLAAFRAGDHSAIGIPFIGGYVPKGFEPTENLYFVDSSGFGGTGEAALTMDQFLSRVVPGLSYAADVKRAGARRIRGGRTRSEVRGCGGPG